MPMHIPGGHQNYNENQTSKCAKRRRINRKETAPSVHCVGDGIAFAQTWSEYINGKVVSKHACQLITNVLTNTLAREQDNQDNEEQADVSDIDEEIPPLKLEGKDLKRLMRRLHDEEPENEEN